MSTDSWRQSRATGLMGRRAECDVLGRLVEPVRAGESRVLVVRGEPGVGKTLRYAEYIVTCYPVRSAHERLLTRQR